MKDAPGRQLLCLDDGFTRRHCPANLSFSGVTNGFDPTSECRMRVPLKKLRQVPESTTRQSQGMDVDVDEKKKRCGECVLTKAMVIVRESWWASKRVECR